eukprot:41990-Hanusia_phi.AAC.1
MSAMSPPKPRPVTPGGSVFVIIGSWVGIRRRAALGSAADLVQDAAPSREPRESPGGRAERHFSVRSLGHHLWFGIKVLLSLASLKVMSVNGGRAIREGHPMQVAIDS